MNTTIEHNKIIAEFMCALYDEQEKHYYFSNIAFKSGKNYFNQFELKFDTDWNWLMEVVEKIESKNFENDNCISFLVKITNSNCQILDLFKDRFEINIYEKTKIEAVYNACLEFIKWYNDQQISAKRIKETVKK